MFLYQKCVRPYLTHTTTVNKLLLSVLISHVYKYRDSWDSRQRTMYRLVKPVFLRSHPVTLSENYLSKKRELLLDPQKPPFVCGGRGSPGFDENRHTRQCASTCPKVVDVT